MDATTAAGCVTSPEPEVVDDETPTADAVEMLRRALSGGVSSSEQEDFIQAFMRLHVSGDERLRALERDNKELKEVSTCLYLDVPVSL